MDKSLRTQIIVIVITYIVLIFLGVLLIWPKLGASYFWFYIIVIFLLLGAHLVARILSKNKQTRIVDLENKFREMN